MSRSWFVANIALTVAVALACGTDSDAPTFSEGECEVADTSVDTQFLQRMGCKADFDTLASVPINANIPGARSVKVVLDRDDNNALYFQNSRLYPIHHDFASTHLSGGALPIVLQRGDFDATEYYVNERRFILGSVTHYEGPNLWALELAPYDLATADMITTLFEAVKAASYFGPGLSFHPTSDALTDEAGLLPTRVPIATTEDIYAGTDYQPLTLGSAMGRLRFLTTAALATEYLSPRDIVVLDEAPNDISVVAGLITQEFQTPLSHVNVLSQNRGTPNMGLRGALADERLTAHDGQWVEFTVDATEWTIREVTAEEARAFYDAHRPEPVTLPALNLSVTGLWDIEELVPETSGAGLRDELKDAVLAFGGKAAHYSVLAQTDGVPVRKAFAVPVFYYDQFMRDNGFYDRVETLLQDSTFVNDPALRDAALKTLRNDMRAAPVNPDFQTELRAKLDTDYPDETIRFRTSTNSEDLDGFPCAGCYESQTGDPADWNDLLDAIKKTWASIWLFRTFEERDYYGIAHNSVGMALLCHHNFPDEEANGVAVTNNIYDPSGREPALYVNVQFGGDAEVVHPPPGTTSDQFLYFFSSPNQPITYLAHSNLVAAGTTVLTTRQIYNLGLALDAIHDRFSPAYGPAAGNNDWYAMDVEFKFDDEGGTEPVLFVKQARPYPGRGDSTP